MDENLRQEIEELLEHLDAQENTSASPPDENQQGAEVIDVFIVRRQMEKPAPPTVESTLAATSEELETQAAPAGQETAERKMAEPPFPPLPRKPRRRALPFVVGALCVMVVGLLSAATLLILLAPSATVTIIPNSAQLTITRTITVVPSDANAAQQQIPGRPLATITLSQAKTVPTTGVDHEPAQAAHGLITFYNALPVPQTIPAGELLTGSDGVEVVTDEDALIPAAVMPTEGQVSAFAHAVNFGPQGNIRAGDIYGKCCRDDVFVSNGPFRGGQNARSYQMVRQQDIDAVAASLKASLDQGVQAALSQQVQSNETLVTPVPCTTTVTPDHKAGSEATQVSITMSETCTGEVYDTSAFHDLLMQEITQQATKQVGTGYGLVGDLQASITKAAMNIRQGTAALQVKVSSMWIYQFSQAQQNHIKIVIRGKSKEEATALLLHVPGVQTVSISIKNGNAIPTDVQRIHLNFVLLA